MAPRYGTCDDCGARVTGTAARCKSCAAKQRWAGGDRKPQRPFIEFGDIRFYENQRGYWRASRHHGGLLLHRAVWQAAHGPIGPETVIHHIDHDPGNNALSNLAATTQNDHAGHHYDGGLGAWLADPANADRRSAISRERRRPTYDKTCDECRTEFTTTSGRARFCSVRCRNRYWSAKRSTR